MILNEFTIFDELLATHTAPTLLGIKSANLFTYRKENAQNISHYINEFNSKLMNKGIQISILCECDKRAMIFLYRKDALELQLNERKRSEILKKFGYNKDWTLTQKLLFLGTRISKSKDFPHEIGLFLDYPIHDVLGFINNKGQDYKFIGYWKVYDNEDNAKRRFANFTKCRVHLKNKVGQGLTIYQALKIA